MHSQVEDTDGECLPRGLVDSSLCSGFDTTSPHYSGVMVGAVITMPTAAERNGHGQHSVVRLEKMLGTSCVLRERWNPLVPA